jgi:flagellar biosynthesis/type III secretory pathway protein FliH
LSDAEDVRVGDGATDGTPEGASDGDENGTEDGASEGSNDGWSDGFDDGTSEGKSDGKEGCNSRAPTASMAMAKQIRVIIFGNIIVQISQVFVTLLHHKL